MADAEQRHSVRVERAAPIATSVAMNSYRNLASQRITDTLTTLTARIGARR